jgi:hypothetical protein
MVCLRSTLNENVCKIISVPNENIVFVLDIGKEHLQDQFEIMFR